MPYLTVGRDAGNIDIYYEDHGVGNPVVLIHGFPLSSRSWERQIPPLIESGHRVIVYDRRGFGRSSQTIAGYNYDVFAEDLRKIIKHLDLKRPSLVGFSMGAGEVARYISRYGSQNVARAVFISGVPPYLAQSPENPAGLPDEVRKQIENTIRQDRLTFLTGFFETMYNADVLLGSRLTEEELRYSWNIGSMASPSGTLQCVGTWWTDFRGCVTRIDVPTLIIHGDADRTIPLEGSSRLLQKAIRGSRLAIIQGAPHGLLTTHADKVNPLLVDFLR
ncbi:alpha/beta fold hydrolase [Edaphobacter sp. 12200R-103]|jgi:non-heme chloroperoxidase|uniref:alpha/beta fold hydrolase n=1 Tax=Edaphobacter sp. 12200R-103 TaxID=2703788 RepID=UPI00138D5374|nr:alpha/beta hydrolase [Edaphobacter sp. 12200R-103]QHS52902.1 alpha/beta hydrolase [Edaphobacter sp. 12200R-103]